MPTAVIVIPIATPVADEPDAENTIRRLRDMAECAIWTAGVVQAAAHHGWALHTPEIVEDSGDYRDIFIALLKDFPDEHAAELEARVCTANRDRFNASWGWNVNRSHPAGPTHVSAAQWWAEL